MHAGLFPNILKMSCFSVQTDKNKKESQLIKATFAHHNSRQYQVMNSDVTLVIFDSNDEHVAF